MFKTYEIMIYINNKKLFIPKNKLVITFVLVIKSVTLKEVTAGCDKFHSVEHSFNLNLG